MRMPGAPPPPCLRFDPPRRIPSDPTPMPYVARWLFGPRNRAIATLRSQGALSPATAKSLDELHITPDQAWTHLIIHGRVREGPTGRFYLFEPPRASPRERALKMIVFYVLIILIPLALVLLTDSGHR
ncbi:MAG TPA: hypothetical protein VHB25_10720 [Gemmatimonadaceae bacterium]|nr:hypothetical protein [Gemmatimonadaceae bacterium]